MQTGMPRPALQQCSSLCSDHLDLASFQLHFSFVTLISQHNFNDGKVTSNRRLLIHNLQSRFSSLTQLLVLLQTSLPRIEYPKMCFNPSVSTHRRRS